MLLQTGSRQKIGSNKAFLSMLLGGTSNPSHALQWVQCPRSLVSMQLEALIFRIFLTGVAPGFAKNKALLDLGSVSLILHIAASLVATLALPSCFS